MCCWCILSDESGLQGVVFVARDRAARAPLPTHPTSRSVAQCRWGPGHSGWTFTPGLCARCPLGVLSPPQLGSLHIWLSQSVFPVWCVSHPGALRALAAPGRVIEKYL